MKNFDLLPYGDPEDWIIAFIDVETTGLKPGYHEMIDLGVVLATLAGEKINEFFGRIMPEHPERASEDALSCNGFSVERWKSFGAVTTEEMTEAVVRFYEQSADQKNILFCAYNESFDHAFLDHLFRGTNHSFRDLHNYTLDLPSIAWGMGLPCLHGGELVEYLDVREEPNASDDGTDPWEHTGLTGARKNLRIYRSLLDRN